MANSKKINYAFICALISRKKWNEWATAVFPPTTNLFPQYKPPLPFFEDLNINFLNTPYIFPPLTFFYFTNIFLSLCVFLFLPVLLVILPHLTVLFHTVTLFVVYTCKLWKMHSQKSNVKKKEKKNQSRHCIVENILVLRNFLDGVMLFSVKWSHLISALKLQHPSCLPKQTYQIDRGKSNQTGDQILPKDLSPAHGIPSAVLSGLGFCLHNEFSWAPKERELHHSELWFQLHAWGNDWLAEVYSELSEPAVRAMTI